MAKSKLNEKITTTHKVDIECTLNTDNLPENVLIGEVEEVGEVDLAKYFKKFNEKYIKISMTEKTEEEPEDE